MYRGRTAGEKSSRSRREAAKRNPTVAQVAATPNSSNKSRIGTIAFRAPRRFSRYGPFGAHLSRTPQCSSKSSETTSAPKSGFCEKFGFIRMISTLIAGFNQPASAFEAVIELQGCLEPLRCVSIRGNVGHLQSSDREPNFGANCKVPQSAKNTVCQATFPMGVRFHHSRKARDRVLIFPYTSPEKVR